VIFAGLEKAKEGQVWPWRSSLVLVLGLLIASAAWLSVETAQADEEPEFTEAVLNDPARIAQGKELFEQECQNCHGATAYPGKAPKLKPKRLAAEDVYLRMTYGWRNMPAWEEILSQDERVALTAYIKSRKFSP
jgi:mono/diheme cytochrome c family protein